MKIAVTSMGDKVRVPLLLLLLCIFIIEGNANFQLEESGNKELIFFLSMFTETLPPPTLFTDTSPPE